MQETETPSQPENQEQKPARSRIKIPAAIKKIVRLFWDSIWELSGLSKLGDKLRVEVFVAVKRTAVLFIVCFSVMTILIMRGCDKDSQIAGLKQLNDNNSSNNAVLQTAIISINASNTPLFNSYQLQVQTLTSAAEEKSKKITELILERDTAQIKEQEANHSLGQWILLAHSNQTNTPLTVSMGLLTAAVSNSAAAFSAASNELEKSRPRFKLVINRQDVSQGTTILLKDSRDIYLQVLNEGITTAEKLTIDIFFGMSKTNFVFDSTQWKSERLVLDKSACGVSTVAEIPQASGKTFLATSFSVSTNCPAHFIQSHVEVYSLNSKNQKYDVLFIIP